MKCGGEEMTGENEERRKIWRQKWAACGNVEEWLSEENNNVLMRNEEKPTKAIKAEENSGGGNSKKKYRNKQAWRRQASHQRMSGVLKNEIIMAASQSAKYRK